MQDRHLILFFPKIKSHGGTYSGKRVLFPPGGVSSALFLTLAMLNAWFLVGGGKGSPKKENRANQDVCRDCSG